MDRRFRAAEVREEQEREARLEEAQAAAKKAREYQSELEHRLQIQVGYPIAVDNLVWAHTSKSRDFKRPCSPSLITLKVQRVQLEFLAQKIPCATEACATGLNKEHA